MIMFIRFIRCSCFWALEKQMLKSRRWFRRVWSMTYRLISTSVQRQADQSTL